ncbi:DUF2065 domain-containing protein [Rhizobium sp. C1]|uniref:DUF2065 domain-containing protein n=1 Tax=Rhizobium sp. C1 TaxID=1349799 RepID=UPI001E65E02E|nr:DUF2065 domain-containing protein [Rhizobium sp. C1]MCD2176611.1 DUF2065 domain-containing protein [Rhizobium sp. C1]
MSALATDGLIGLAFLLIIEGLAYALAPRLIKNMAQQIPAMSEERLRVFGVVALALGVGLVWLVH